MRKSALLHFVMATAFVTLLHSASAATLTWDASPASAGPQDGSGTWDAANTNWWTGAANAAWNSAAPDSAIFGATGTAGTVTLGAPITAGSLTFTNVAGGTYLLQGNTLTLSGAPVIATVSNATINASLSGAGFVKNGAASLTLGGTNSLSGAVIVSNGTLTAAAGSQLNNGAGLAVLGAASVANLNGCYTNTTGSGSVSVNSGGTINFSGTGTVATVTAAANGAANNFRNFVIGGGSAGRFNVTGGSLGLTNGLSMLVGSGTGGGGTLNISGGSVTVTNTGSTNGGWFMVGYATATGAVNVTGGSLSIGYGGGRIFIGGADPGGPYGTGTLTVAGGGAVNIGPAGSFPNDKVYLAGYGGRGQINLNGGTLTSARDIQLGSGGPAVFVFNGGTLRAGVSSTTFLNTSLIISNNPGGAVVDTAGFNDTIAAAILNGGGGLTKTGAGILTLSNVGSTFTGHVVVAAGTLVAGAGNNNPAPASTALGAAVGVGGRVIAVNSNATLRFAANDVLGNALSSPSPTLVITNGGLVIISNNFTTLGPVLLSGGTLSGYGGVSTSFQRYAFAGTVTVTGDAASTIGALGGANNADHLGSNTTFNVADVTGDANPDLIMAAPLANLNASLGSGPGGFTKTGAGTMRLDTNNWFTGTAAVLAGTLALGTGGSLSNATVALGAGGSFDVSAYGAYTPPPGQVIQGDGTVVGSVLTENGSRIHPGGAGTPGTLTFANDLLLSLSAGHTNTFDLTNNLAIGGGINDLLVVNGDFEPDGNPVRINALAPLVSGTYRLINYGVNSGGMSFGPLLGATSRDTWMLDTSVNTQVNLIVAAGTNLALRWSANTSAEWDLGTTNWTVIATSSPDRYFDMDTVLFDDSGASSNLVTLTTVVKPASVTVNASSNYTFAGAGRISDGFGLQAPLTKDGGGRLTLATTNDFSGGVVVSNGTVVLASAAAIGSGPVALAGGTTLEDAAGGTLANAISGGGRVVKSGGGTLTLSRANTYTGTTTISNGTLAVSGPGFLGGGAYAADIQNNGALVFNGATQVLSGVLSGTGSLAKAGSGTLTLGGTLANVFSGATLVSGAASNIVLLAKPGNVAAIGGDLVFSPSSGNAEVLWNADEQIPDSSTIDFGGVSHLHLELLGHTETVARISATNGFGVIENRQNQTGVDTSGTFVVNGPGASSFNGYLRNANTSSGTGVLNLRKEGGGSLALSGANITHTGATTVADGTLTLQDTTAFASPVSIGATGTLNLVRTGLGFANRSTMAGNAITGSGILNVNNAGSGLAGGWVRVNTTNAMNFTGTININSGVFGTDSAGGAGVIAGSATVNVSTGGVFVNHSSAGVTIGALNGSGHVTPAQSGGGTYNLTLGAGNQSGSYAGVLHGNNSSGGTDGTMEAGFLSLTKIGAGTQTLSGTNTYSGITVISNGVLALGAGGSITGTPRIVVGSGATFDVSALGTLLLAGPQSLEGAGLVTGVVSAAAGSRIVPGASGAVATLTFANDLGLNAAATNYFDLRSDTTAGNGTNDLVNVGGLLEPSNAVIAVTTLSPLTNGTYRLFNYTGAKATVFNTNVLGNATRKTWALDEATPGQVNLVVTGSYASLRWNPVTSTNWDFAGTNWLDLATSTTGTFLQSDAVLFDDNGAYLSGVNLAAAVAPQSITVNSSSNYSITGTGKITGSTGIHKDGAGTLTLGGTGNDYTGPVAVSGGTVSVGADLGLGAVPATYSPAQVALDGGTLRVTAALTIPANRGITLGSSGGTLDTASSAVNNQEFFNSVITGNGPLVLNGNGNLTDTGGGSAGFLQLSVSNVFAGAVTINSGIISFTNDAAFGQATNVLTMNGGGLVATINRTLDRQIVLAGGGDRIFRSYGNASFTANGNISGQGNIRRTDGGTNIFNGNLTFTGSFINAAANTWLLGTNTYTGGTTITNNSILHIRELSDSGPSGIANSGLLTFGGGTLRYVGAAAVDTARNVTNTGASTYDLTDAAAVLTLNGPVAGPGALTKNGPGQMILAGTNTYTGTTTVNGSKLTLARTSSNAIGAITVGGGAAGGVLNVNGVTGVGAGQTTVGNAAGDRSIVYIGTNLTTTTGKMFLGFAAGSAGAVIQTGGVVSVGSGLGGADYLSLGRSGTGYGYYRMIGDQLITGQLALPSSSGGGNGVFDLISGNVNVNSPSGWLLFGWTGGTNVINVYDGSISNPPSGNNLTYGFSANAGSYGTLNILGSGLVNSTVGNRSIDMMLNAGNFGSFLNLNSGTLIANQIRQSAAGPTYFGFNGGTLLSTGGVTQTAFLQGLTAAYVYPGGAIIDTSNSVLAVAQPLTAPAGQGVASISVATAGAGYIGNPTVILTGGGGVGATAIANVDFDQSSPTYGQVTNIRVTSAGSGYTGAPTVAMAGGGPTNLAAAGTVTLAANTGGGLTKLGTGSLTLHASNNYSGATAVNNGSLLVNGIHSGTGGYSVAPGATLWGTGVISAASATISTGGWLGARSTSLTGRLTVVNATLNPGSRVSALLRGTNPTIRTTGNLNSSPSVYVQVLPLAAGTGVGTNVLLDYDGTFGGNIADFALGSVPNGGQGYLALNVANSSVDLVVTNAGTGIKWDGAVNDQWRIGSVANWKSLLTGNAAEFTSFDSVLFDDTAAGNYVVNLAELVVPSSLVVSNETQDYTFTGGGIGGAVALMKAGAAKLTVSAVNSYAGQTLVSGGTLSISSDASLGAAPGAAVTNQLRLLDGTTLEILGNTTLAANRGVQIGPASGSGFTTVSVAPGIAATEAGIVANPPGATGGLIKAGSGRLTLSAANTFSGNVGINNGTLALSGGANRINTNSTVSVAAGAAFDLGGQNQLLMGLTGQGSVTSSAGTLTLVLASSVTNQIDGVLSGGFGITKLTNGTSGAFGGGVLVLNGTNTFTGLVDIQVGRVVVKNSASLGTGPKQVNLTNGTAGAPCLVLDGSGGSIVLASNISFNTSSTASAITNAAGDNVINGNFTLTSGGGSTAIKCEAGTLTLNGNLTFNQGSRVLDLGGKATGTVRGAILAGGQTAVGLSKNDSGLWIITGSNTYTAVTTVFGGTLQVGDGGTTGNLSTNTVVLSTNNPSARVVFNRSDVFTNQLITGVGSVVQAGAGTLVFHAGQAYTGPTIVSNGTLLVQGALATGAVSVSAGGTLGGTGLVRGPVSSDGIVAPGASAGRLFLGQTYTQTAGGALHIEIGGTDQGVNYDELVVSNSVALDGALTVSLFNGYAGNLGDTFVVLESTGITGGFATTNLPALGGGLDWRVNYLGGSLVVLSVTNAPAPSGYDLWAAAITNGLTNYNESATGDGYPNLLKYATGSSPTNADDLARMNSGRTNGFFALKFNHNTGATDVTLYIEGAYASTNDAAWSGIATNIHGSWGATTNYSEDTGVVPAAVTVWDTEPAATNRFLRLRVTRP